MRKHVNPRLDKELLDVGRAWATIEAASPADTLE
jgi:hypothetical protein